MCFILRRTTKLVADGSPEIIAICKLIRHFRNELLEAGIVIPKKNYSDHVSYKRV